MTRPRPVPMTGPVPPFMAGIVLAVPGIVIEDDATGARVVVLPDGRLEHLHPGGHPRPGTAHATAVRR